MKLYENYMNDIVQMHYNIIQELNELTEEEISDFGAVLFTEFFGEDGDEGYKDIFDNISEYDFTYNQVMTLIENLGVENYDIVLDLLEEIEEDDTSDVYDNYELKDDLDEAFSNRMKSSNYNKNKRKFMIRSASEIRRNKIKARQNYRKNKISIKQYRSKNKAKIRAYQKSRRNAIRKGTHKVKLRRKS